MDASTLSSLYYLVDGTIKAYDKEIENDIEVRLNLNCVGDGVTLPQNRKAVLDAIQEELDRASGDLLQNCQDILQILENETDPKTPYIGIGVWWLREQIREMQKNS